MNWLLSIARGIVRRIPVSPETKGRALLVLFSHAPWLVKWTRTYKVWVAEQARIAARRLDLEHQAALHKSNEEYSEVSGLPRPDKLLARAIAFYLPQFHAIPENDRWWGKGFTEWTNVRRATPQFEGHEQPRHPGELGYYDLVEQPWIRRRQAALAHQYGLEGFCFYFYWFGGKRLLEAPIEAYANDEEISFPFCLCWANESWSRRWDGKEEELLIAQSHSAEDDLEFIAHLAKYLRNKKYIRVNRRPLILVYRPGILPDAKATVNRWREWCRENGVGEIYVAYTQSFDTADPAEFGMDAAIEFPPNNMGLSPKEGLVEAVDPDNFACRIYDWFDLKDRFERSVDAGYRLYRGVTPQWDNTPRRGSNATVLQGSSGAAYTFWLASIVADTAANVSDPEQRLIFINAWNEWAEGAYLEPDQRHGYKWLSATRNALRPGDEAWPLEPRDLVPLELPENPHEAPKIIVVVHDLHRHGAQFLSLSFVRSLSTVFGYNVVTIACGEGILQKRFETYGEVIGTADTPAGHAALAETLGNLSKLGFTKAIVNSSASGWIVPHLVEANIESVGLVHELPEIAAAMGLKPGMEAMNNHCRSVIFASNFVKTKTARGVLNKPWRNPVIQPQGLYKLDGIVDLSEKAAARRALQVDFGTSRDAKFVLGVGFADHRKGIDIFIEWAIAAVRDDPSWHFVWLGEISSDMQDTCAELLADAADVAEHIHLVGFQDDTAPFYKAASAYALSSREDPFPSTPIEAMAAGTPAIMVRGTGGLVDLKDSGALHVIANAKPASFVRALKKLTKDRKVWRRAANAGLDVARSQFGFVSFVGDVLRLLDEPVPKISVVVPNFNYARYLPSRLSTILNQSLPVWEIVFLDDASDDNSLSIAIELLRNCSIRYRIIRNRTNSGSVFKQWKKGVDQLAGDIVWIAEADDWAGRDFLRVAASAFKDPQTVLSFTQSHQVDSEGDILSADYVDYLKDVDAARWRKPFQANGLAELASGFSVKNPIPNVSAALFRRTDITAVLNDFLDEVLSYRVAGDWCVYTHLLKRGDISFDPRPLNFHRRHQTSVTISRFTQADWDEIKRMQERVSEIVEVDGDLQDVARNYLEHLKSRL